MPDIEHHPLPAFAPTDARLLLLGSFPPPRARWKMEFFYPNLQNDMWRILGMVFFDDPFIFLTSDRKGFELKRIKAFLRETGIAVWDVAMAVRRLRGNASDQYLEIVEAIDLQAVLEKMPQCQAVVVTGQKALDTLCTIVECSAPKLGERTTVRYAERDLSVYRMPSSSRAYPLPLVEKAAFYRGMFLELGLLMPVDALI